MRIFCLFFLFFSANIYCYEIAFWNLQNLHSPDLTKNPEYMPINHSYKKEGCLLQKIFFRKKNCLLNHWTEDKYQKRIQSFRYEIGRFRGKDLWCFCEVGQEKSIREILKNLDYRYFFSTSDNKREQNIICAWNDKFQKSISSVKELDLGPDLRKFLYFEFNLKNEKYILIPVHFPSQFNKSEERFLVMEKLLTLTKGKKFILLGDFNFNNQEKMRYDKFLLEYEGDRKGTYFYKKSKKFNSFDLVFSNKRIGPTKILKPTKTKLYKGNTIPFAYSNGALEGLSDHFPISIHLKH